MRESLPTMRYRIALCGFSDFEHRAMDFSFRQPRGLARSGYDLVDALSDADFIVVDADSKPAVKCIVLSGRVAKTVFVGSAAPAGAAAHVKRPIDPTRILRALDDLTGAREIAEQLELLAPELLPPELFPSGLLSDAFMPAASWPAELLAPAPLPRADLELPTLDDVVAAHEPNPEPLPSAGLDTLSEAAEAPPAAGPEARVVANKVGVRVAAQGVEARVAAQGVEARVAAHNAAKAAARAAARRARQASMRSDALAAEPLCDVLVFDADPVTTRSLCDLLVRFGFRPHTVGHLAQIGDELGARPFAALFLDIELDDHGVALLRRIRELPVAPGHPQPAVLLLASRLDPGDRVAAALAGLPDPLLKPLGRGDVARALERCGVPLPSDARGG